MQRLGIHQGKKRKSVCDDDSEPLIKSKKGNNTEQQSTTQRYRPFIDEEAEYDNDESDNEFDDVNDDLSELINDEEVEESDV